MPLDSYTIKELVNELRKEQSELVKTQAVILTKLDNIDGRIDDIVTQNKIRNSRTEKLETKVSYLWGGIALLSALGVSNLVTWVGI